MEYLHEFIGYTIQTQRSIPIIAIWQGGGRNGKSSIADLIVALLGHNHVAALRVKDLSRNQFSSNALFGKLLFLDDDVQSNTRLPDGDLKKISEGRLISAEQKNGPNYTFFNRAFPLLLCNNLPTVADLSAGFRRRLFILPFKREFSDDEIDRKLFDRIKETELPGVLNHALRGLQRVIRRGWRFETPNSMQTALLEFLKQANPLPDFVEGYCERKRRYLLSELYRHFEVWCKDQGVTYVKQSRMFKRDLMSMGFNIVHRRDGDTIIGLSPRDAD